MMLKNNLKSSAKLQDAGHLRVQFFGSFRMRMRMRMQQGFIAGYALAGIALMTIAMAGLTAMSKSSAQKILVFNASKTIQSHISSIHSVLSTCAVLYPSGNNGSGFHRAYPAGTAASVLNLTCPGSPYSNKNLWTGRNGERPPLMPNGLSTWAYTNDATGIYITTSSSGDADLNKSIAMAAGKYVSTQVTVTGNVFKYWILKE